FALISPLFLYGQAGSEKNDQPNMAVTENIAAQFLLAKKTINCQEPTAGIVTNYHNPPLHFRGSQIQDAEGNIKHCIETEAEFCFDTLYNPLTIKPKSIEEHLLQLIAQSIKKKPLVLDDTQTKEQVLDKGTVFSIKAYKVPSAVSDAIMPVCSYIVICKTLISPEHLEAIRLQLLQQRS
ncbi:MAG TPA: hypothetical protein VFF04_01450, partial [Candidatus Babeliales bacterium]|nr:hypothetical protein [Candidatus Babeliales bacterium]